MYTLTKMFDKSSLAADETITKFWFDGTNNVFAVETNKSVYKLTVKA